MLDCELLLLFRIEKLKTKYNNTGKIGYYYRLLEVKGLLKTYRDLKRKLVYGEKK